MIDAYYRVVERIQTEAIKSGRNPEEITLVVASKYGTPKEINQLFSCGQSVFGENRADALMNKKSNCPEKIQWHFIGQLQTNKVKSIIDKVVLIHSLDRWSLAQMLDRQAKDIGIMANALIEVRFSDVEGRGGIHPNEIRMFLDRCETLENLSVQGLMCMAPAGANEMETYRCFENVRNIYDRIKETSGRNNMIHLSMGMSNDYHIAIQNGATMVRVGSSIFRSPD